MRRAQPPAQQQKANAPAQKAPPGTAAVPFPEVRSACSAEIRSHLCGRGSRQRRIRAMPAPEFRGPYAALSGRPQPSRQRRCTADRGRTEAKPDEPAGTSATPRVVSTDRITRPEGMQESDAPDLKLPAMRPTQEARWVNRNCKEDHSLLCQGVTFGQSRVLRCLLSHHSSLTNSCRKALAKR